MGDEFFTHQRHNDRFLAGLDQRDDRAGDLRRRRHWWRWQNHDHTVHRLVVKQEAQTISVLSRTRPCEHVNRVPQASSFREQLCNLCRRLIPQACQPQPVGYQRVGCDRSRPSSVSQHRHLGTFGEWTPGQRPRPIEHLLAVPRPNHARLSKCGIEGIIASRHRAGM